MDKYKQYFKKDRFAAHNEIILADCRPGYAKATVKIKNYHLNGADVVHGGLLFTLADFCFAAAVNSYGNVSLSINADISFFCKSTEGATITAEATEISRSNKLSSYTISVKDEKGTLLAEFRGTAYITKDIINF